MQVVTEPLPSWYCPNEHRVQFPPCGPNVPGWHETVGDELGDVVGDALGAVLAGAALGAVVGTELAGDDVGAAVGAAVGLDVGMEDVHLVLADAFAS